eukprot:TRINITY_DN460_c0_g1_i2.p1 TRINITY_DN460_c0_g1~~TRINITY_DN460_c0_g1_i2.p1  ORF type:complete len:741 (-),score=412.22 TRINITY_DN460_c0_g1_i2:121-2310(-)
MEDQNNDAASLSETVEAAAPAVEETVVAEPPTKAQKTEENAEVPAAATTESSSSSSSEGAVASAEAAAASSAVAEAVLTTTPLKKRSRVSAAGLKRAGTINETAAEAAAFLGYQGDEKLLKTEKGPRYETRSRRQARETMEEIMKDGSKTASKEKKADDDEDDEDDEDDWIEEWDEKKERKNLATVFRIFDTNYEGFIDEEKLADVFRSLGTTPEKSKIREVFKEATAPSTDASSSSSSSSSSSDANKLSLSAFVEYMIKKRKEKLPESVKAKLEEQEKLDASPKRSRSKSPSRKKTPAKKAKKSKSPPPAKKTKAAAATPKKTKAATAAATPKTGGPKKAGGDTTSSASASAVKHKAGRAAGPTASTKNLTQFYQIIGEGDHDLGVAGAFKEYHTLVYNGQSGSDSVSQSLQKSLDGLSASLGLNFQVVNSVLALYNILKSSEGDKYDALWIVSGNTPSDDLWKDITEDEFVSALDAFSKSGRGLALFASEDPFFVEANTVLNKFFQNEPTSELSGNDTETSLLQATETMTLTAPGFLRNLLTTGVATLSEAPNYSSLALTSKAFESPLFRPIAVSSSNKVVLAVRNYDNTSFPPVGRVVVDSSFRKYLNEGLGVHRLLSNISVWLLGVDVRLSTGMPLRGPLNKMDCTYVWQYYHNGWYNYESKASVIVEKCYQEYLSNPGRCDVRDVKSGDFSYQVDFINMQQTNIVHHAHTQRKIRRVPQSMSVV